VNARISDSAMYSHLWGTSEIRDIFGERERINGWVNVLGALARAQAKVGLIPEHAAAAVSDETLAGRLDVDRIAEGTRETGHSTLGLIHELRRCLPESAREFVYMGATVQDVTDTWTSMTIKKVGEIIWRDIHRFESLLLELAHTHRNTLMCGRTHGQPGAPTTFGWKVASWADEVRRHVERLVQGKSRWLVGQLGGGIGTLVAYGSHGMQVREHFCAELGLEDPIISWLSARDRMAEFTSVLDNISGTLARIGNEIYALQRPEIAELSEPQGDSVTSSITMHHKRNPELSEHLDTLARLVRSHTTILSESIVSQHERDGRTWKTEWVALPEVCLLTGAALSFAISLIENLEVHHEQMADNMRKYLGETQNPSDPGSAPTMVDLVVKRGRTAHQSESQAW